MEQELTLADATKRLARLVGDRHPNSVDRYRRTGKLKSLAPEDIDELGLEMIGDEAADAVRLVRELERLSVEAHAKVEALKAVRIIKISTGWQATCEGKMLSLSEKMAHRALLLALREIAGETP